LWAGWVGQKTWGHGVYKVNIEIIGLGALNIDHIYKVERILDDGEAVASEASAFPGGSAANTIYALAKLGVKTGFSGVVGDDDEGRMLLRDFQAVGVDTSRIRVKLGEKTGSVLCLSDRRGKRSLYVSPSANNLLTIDDLDLGHMNQAGMLHLSSFADDKQFKLSVELVEKLGSSVKLSFAPGAIYAVKGLKALAPILSRTYILFINQDELQQLTGEEVKAGAESCLKQGCHNVAVTLGKGGKLGKAAAVSYIRDADNEYVIEPQDFGAEVDTTGAGDAFAAGFIYGLLKKKKLGKCGQLGDTLARFCIAKMGARQGLPTLNQLSQRYRQLYNQEL
jgi:ribokinase